MKNKYKYKKFFKYILSISEEYELEYLFDNENIILKHTKLDLDVTLTLNNKHVTTILFDKIILPPNLKIYHFNVKIQDYPTAKLADDLYIQESLKIIDSPKLHYFAKNTTIDKSLWVEQSNIKKINNIKTSDLYVDDSFLLKEITNINVMFLSANNCHSLKKIHNIHTESVYLHNCKALKKIDDSITITNNLIIINNTKIKKLPKLNLEIISILNTKIKELDKDTIIRDSLLANNSELKKLPDNMNLNSLILEDCKNLKKLGKNLKVHSLNISGSGLRSLPSDLSFIGHKKYNKDTEGSLLINNTKIKKLPQNIKNNKVDIVVNNQLIENIYEFYKSKTIRFCVIYESITFYVSNDKINKNILNILDEENREKYKRNILLLNSTKTIERKLLLEHFNKINAKDIKQLKSLSAKQLANNTINFRLICYCRSKQAYEFLYQNGYHFNKKELNLISKLENINLKNLYEMYLLKYNINPNGSSHKNDI